MSPQQLYSPVLKTSRDIPFLVREPEADRGLPLRTSGFSPVGCRTGTCWPKIARTAHSNASQAPGMRKPGRRFTSGPSRGSDPNASPILAALEGALLQDPRAVSQSNWICAESRQSPRMPHVFRCRLTASAAYYSERCEKQSGLFLQLTAW